MQRVRVEFPQRSQDSSLIFSRPGSHSRPMSMHPQIGYGMPSNSPMSLDEAMASDNGNLSLSDLDGIRHVMELLTDMLQAVNPNDRVVVKDELIVDLVSQCRTNQKKLMQLVSSTGDEELLEQGLSLNDSLQSLLAKHDAIASGSPLPAEVPQSIPSPTAPFEPTPLAGNHSKEEKEDSEEDEFAQLAHRNRPPTAQMILASETSPKDSDIATAATATSVSDSSIASSALVLSDPPPAVGTSKFEQDMIELLSITLSTNPSSPEVPLTPSTSQQTESPISHSSTEQQGYPQNSPHFGNEGHNPSSGYVAPWAPQTPTQPQPVPLPPSESLSPPQPTFQSQYQVPQYSSYPPPPWAPSAIGQSNPFLSNGYQYPSTQTTVPVPVPDSRTLQYNNSFERSINASPPVVEAQLTANQRQDSRPLQHYNSFGRSNNASSSAGEAQMTANQRQESGTAAKPFVPSYRLFEDLIDLRNTDKRIKVRTQTSLSGTSAQGTISGRK